MDEDLLIKGLKTDLEELQYTINSIIMKMHTYDKDLAAKYNEIRYMMFKTEKVFEDREGIELEYLIGFSTTKELQEYGY